MNGWPRWARGLAPLGLAWLAALAAGCGTQGVVVERSASTTPTAAPAAPDSVLLTKGNRASVSTIRSQQQCQAPDENYDFATVVTQRFGTEAVLRLQRLLSSDMASSSIDPKDREILKVLSREMVWIPAAVEEKIGAALLLASSRNITQLPRDGANKEFWDDTTKMLLGLMDATPPNPFEMRLLLIQGGAPSSLAGGIIFVDNDTVKSSLDEDTDISRAKLRFILAHELAHIQKRHRAKRIQQLLVDSEAGLKLTRQIFKMKAAASSNSANFLAGIMDWAQMAVTIPEVVKALLNHHEKYEQDQELEADACATAMMLAMPGGGDPVKAFQAYKDEVDKTGSTATQAPGTGAAPLMALSMTGSTHPPNEVRMKNIEDKVADYTGQTRPAPAASPASGAPQLSPKGPAPKAKAGTTATQKSAPQKATGSPPAKADSASNKKPPAKKAETGKGTTK